MLYDSELKIMEILWENGDMYASEISKKAMDLYGWNKNTTYTVIKKLIDKQYIQRVDPKYFCIALIGRQQEQVSATKSLVDRLFEGSMAAFFSHFVSDQKLSNEDMEHLQQIIHGAKDKSQ